LLKKFRRIKSEVEVFDDFLVCIEQPQIWETMSVLLLQKFADNIC